MDTTVAVALIGGATGVLTAKAVENISGSETSRGINQRDSPLFWNRERSL